MNCVHKKLFCDFTDVHPPIIVHNWNSDEDKYVQLKRLLSPHVSQVCAPVDLMRELVKIAAFHDGWSVTEISLSDAYSEEEAVEAMSIADENGNSICVKVDGELIETGNAAELESAVKQTVFQYMGL